jgi:hypothetical protein
MSTEIIKGLQCFECPNEVADEHIKLCDYVINESTASIKSHKATMPNKHVALTEREYVSRTLPLT